MLDSVSEMLNPNNPNGFVPAQEIKSMLDGFLLNLTNQLAATFEGSTRVSSPADENEPRVPGGGSPAICPLTMPNLTLVARRAAVVGCCCC